MRQDNSSLYKLINLLVNKGSRTKDRKLKFPISKNQNTYLIREYDDNYYDKIRVFKSRSVTDIPSASAFSLHIRSIPGLHIDRIFFEDLRLRDEENALPVEEDGDIPDDLLLSYIRSSNTDIIKFVGEYHEKRIEIGISMNDWKIWLRIWHLTDDELNTLEDDLGLS